MLEFRIFRCWDSRIFGCWDFRIFGKVGFSNVRVLVDCDFERLCFGLDDFANLENCKINLSESL